jgi:hypothetical protein
MAPAWMSGVARCRIPLSLWVLFCAMCALLVVVVPRDGVFGSPRGRVALGCGVILCYPLIHCLDIGRLYCYEMLSVAVCGSEKTNLYSLLFHFCSRIYIYSNWL